MILKSSVSFRPDPFTAEHQLLRRNGFDRTFKGRYNGPAKKGDFYTGRVIRIVVGAAAKTLKIVRYDNMLRASPTNYRDFRGLGGALPCGLSVLRVSGRTILYASQVAVRRLF